MPFVALNNPGISTSGVGATSLGDCKQWNEFAKAKAMSFVALNNPGISTSGATVLCDCKQWNEFGKTKATPFIASPLSRFLLSL
jgi:hypothetical protein